jgi:hypothetical protein
MGWAMGLCRVGPCLNKKKVLVLKNILKINLKIPQKIYSMIVNCNPLPRELPVHFFFLPFFVFTVPKLYLSHLAANCVASI